MEGFLIAMTVVYVIVAIVLLIGAFDTYNSRYNDSVWDNFESSEKFAIIAFWPLAGVYTICKGLLSLAKRLGEK